MLKKHGFQIRKLVPFSDSILKPGTLPLKSFKQKVNLKIERERFIIKTAENHEELAKVLRLRYDVFYRELLEKRLLLGIDIDKFDFKCDHLIIIDKKSDSFIGTYRLISTNYSKKFYSETEFKLDNILNLEGVKLELGRACVHRDFRTGSTIALLWRGITQYMKETGTKYLFGCSSVKTTDKREIAAVYKYLKKDFLAPEQYRVYPKGKFKIRNFDKLVESITPEEMEKAMELVPTLVKSYINMGAHICGEPAFDKKFKCADFLTLFNIDTSSDKVHKKYNL
ncbi:MAG: GNAT family N-acetyltransferase [Fibrobacter sp.]|nr:GNAT family N-acetyltransferase [Fibrobacter sp.]